MNLKLIRDAALALGYEEPISIEPDGSIWLNNETNRQDLSETDTKKVHAKASSLEANRAKLKADTIAKLGLTADELALLLS